MGRNNYLQKELSLKLTVPRYYSAKIISLEVFWDPIGSHSDMLLSHWIDLPTHSAEDRHSKTHSYGPRENIPRRAGFQRNFCKKIKVGALVFFVLVVVIVFIVICESSQHAGPCLLIEARCGSGWMWYNPRVDVVLSKNGRGILHYMWK